MKKNRRHGSQICQSPCFEQLEERNLFAATPITFVDGDGTTVKISLSGNGAMVLVGDDLTITGADQGTKLTISNKGGDGRTTLGSINVTGALRSITARTTDYTGDITIAGSVKTLDLGNFLPGTEHALTIGGTANANLAKITFIRATDLTLTTGTPLSSLNVTDWDDTGADDLITAPRINKIKSKEDFAPGGVIVGDDEGEGYLGQVTVEDAMAGAWYVDGKSVGVTTGSAVGNFAFNVRGKFTKMKVYDGFTGTIAAYNVGTITVYGPVVNALILAGADLGTDIALGGTGDEADLFFKGDFTKLYIKGDVAGSTFGAGLDPANGILDDGDDFVTGKRGSNFGSIYIRDIATPDCTFAAGKFASIKIGGTKIDPNGDPRFLLASTIPDETPPVIFAELRNNTGDPGDNITSDYTIVGRVTDLGSIESFRFGVDDDEISEFDSIRHLIEPDGTFELLRSAIEKANKGPLTVGAHTINFLAKDEVGNTAAIFTVAFVFVP